MSEVRLAQRRGHEFTAILGLGDFRPAHVVPNSEIVEAIDSSDEWIRDRSGIAARRLATAEETVVTMSATAARAALDDAGITAEDVDLVVVASITHPWQTPAAAPMVAHAVGAHRAAAYDLGAACAGFCYGVAVADDAVRAGSARHVLVVGTEKFSDFRDPHDRTTAFIFGDGAAAAVVGPSDSPGISASFLGADGAGAGQIAQTRDWTQVRHDWETMRDSGVVPDDLAPFPSIGMEGPAVFRWAVTHVAAVAADVLATAGITADDLDVFVPHQANVRIIDAMVKRMHLPDHVVVARDDLVDMANTSAASVPLALTRLRREGRARSGDLALLLGFGAGLAWAGQVVRVP
ncbi:beta-ketoacyl-ACP synthase III [Mobilicoccus pelagius]|uniref:Beta-ketoacyl-[acyl-carrier-protein] synthase III n=1 Tax=Mobilicoccus pelagius NBRC 104925 TaxID=1089455 RepID=H5UQ05_9MICO|nr:beta-ketoacyl-ACP synthase III [Mobilicoccus pelagius]GAB47810.1 3-oxoacyl-[acyl-carrier-protein] synthase III [Mobilicoccus pelagius NBRC 104925]